MLEQVTSEGEKIQHMEIERDAHKYRSILVKVSYGLCNNYWPFLYYCSLFSARTPTQQSVAI